MTTTKLPYVKPAFARLSRCAYVDLSNGLTTIGGSGERSIILDPDEVRKLLAWVEAQGIADLQDWAGKGRAR